MTPWTAAHQAPLSMGFFQARILEWGAISFSDVLSYKLKIPSYIKEVTVDIINVLVWVPRKQKLRQK